MNKTLAGIVIIVILLAAGVFYVSQSQQPQETIKIGFIGPLSGDAASFGQTERNAVDMALAEINSAGGINGRKIEVIYEDGKCSGKESSTAAQKLVDVDKVKIILGGTCSGETLAIAPITEKNKVVLFSAMSSNPAITDAGDYIFRTSPSDTETGRFSADKMIKKYRKAAILSENTDYAQGVRKIFKEKFAEMGGTLVADEVFNQGERDFRSQILKIKDASPDAILFVPQSGTTQGLGIKQMRELGMDKQVYTIVATADAVDIAGSAMEGTIIVDVPQLPDKGKTVIDRYREMYRQDPANEWEAGARYDSVFIIANALRKCGEDTECVKDFLYRMDWYTGSIGRYKFDSNGDVLGIVYALKVVKGGKFEIINPNEQTQTKGTIKLGALFPLAGDVAQLGIPASQAVEMAVDEINSAGGINGNKIELITENGGCNPKDATTAATKLVDLDHVVAIVGGFCSGETLAAAPIAERGKVVLFSPTSSNPKITEAGDYIFRSYPSDAFQGSFAADYTYNNKSSRKAAILYINNDWGNGIKATFKARFEQLGGTIVAEESFEQSTKDMRTQLTKVKASNPDFIYFPSHPAEAIIGLRQAAELGTPATKFFGGDGQEDETIASSLNSTGEGFMWVVPLSTPPQDFVDRFKAKAGKEPSLGVPQAYDNARILANIIAKAGANGEAVKNELYNLKNYRGVSGTISIDENGDLTTAVYQLRIIRNGKMENA